MGPTPRNRLPLWAVGAAAGAAALLLLGGVALTLMARSEPSATGVVMVRSGGQADIGGPFTLTDETGAAFTEADLRGQPSLIYFGYTFCPDVCPLSLQVMERALERLPEDKRAAVQPIFISVDPERDTVERLARYVETPGFPAGLTGLTGTPEQVEAAKTGFKIFSAKGAEAGDFYLVDHTSLIYLMDEDGKFVAAFGHTESPETIAATVDGLLS